MFSAQVAIKYTTANCNKCNDNNAMDYGIMKQSALISKDGLWSIKAFLPKELPFKLGSEDFHILTYW